MSPEASQHVVLHDLNLIVDFIGRPILNRRRPWPSVGADQGRLHAAVHRFGVRKFAVQVQEFACCATN